LTSANYTRNGRLRGFVSHFAVLLSFICINTIGTPCASIAQQQAAGSNSANNSFDLKAVKNEQGHDASLRISRPGAEDQSNLNGHTSSDGSVPLADPSAFQQGNAQLDRTQKPPFDLGARQLNTGAQDNNRVLEAPLTVRLLADYQIELIVDRSLSMRKRDCPGGLSRWEWCGVQAADLAKAIAPYLPNGLTIIPFASRYDVYPAASAQNIDDLFQHPNFEFGTRLAEPLKDRLDNFLSRRTSDQKPLLIAVITDGVPFPPPEPRMVRHQLIASTHKMKGPNEVTVVFFQIGGQDRFGHNYLDELGNNLVHEGARYDYVHTIPFERLVAIGLPQALVQTIQTFVRNW
jgi:hypothetical protein